MDQMKELQKLLYDGTQVISNFMENTQGEDTRDVLAALCAFFAITISDVAISLEGKGKAKTQAAFIKKIHDGAMERIKKENISMN